ncbi:bifunctional protein (secreted sugar binding protein/sugar hydrolase) [Beutenbergia cavernae DSM 12333]|uniref:Bifunctional protein (Secreted sugar binding protein/sugar hydrolase) n=1 Tax=Beutenbergia cavernae (strain ATCC BAA-8 / DSM 12333 / CCUG 43141 / JCM 11478 / NBRC 16432 / NCIMB 13614 / HKI 0122) TaxID=471853 RepID=C5BWH8_BEUC1|nr:sialidase family protein [Beutenbergia cavernae]ACQ78636.1 bifunctional protein (secreted sugar binding protein/sugar hydrolase) [Beutenbergia cavernae DSM 12333]
MRRALRSIVLFALASLMLVTTASWSSAAPSEPPPPGGAENGTRLMEGPAFYPRTIRLAHAGADDGAIIASVVTFADGLGHGAIFRSDDDGRSFQRIGTVTDPATADGLCCATLFELPQQVGELPAGTLLWSASVGQQAPDRRMTLPVWASTDQGRTWSKVSTIATQPNTGGLWEPEFAVARDGSLVVYVSDESQQPTHSQTLVQATSPDGVHWSELENIVAARDPDLRPGMPLVRQLPNTTYLMSYEICGPGQECSQRTRRSLDGVHWGPETWLGVRVRTADGAHFRHAPTISWYDDGTRNGRLLAVGQMLYGADGTVQPGNGRTIFTSDLLPELPWGTGPAPLAIAEPWNNFCPNYSSSLLAMPERDELLELASGYDDVGECTTYFAVGDLPD